MLWTKIVNSINKIVIVSMKCKGVEKNANYKE